MSFLFVLIAIGIFFWFVAVQPQRRRQRAHVAMQDAVVEGAEIITAGGLHGRVVEGGEDVIRIEIAPATVVRVDRRAVAAVVHAELDEPEADAEGEDEPLATELEPSGDTDGEIRRGAEDKAG